MADLNGINTQNSQAVIRAIVYSGMLREALEPELIAMNYVDQITDFPDGDKWQDVEMGSATVSDYAEGEEIDFKGIEFGVRDFEINEYVNSGHYVTAKFAQDSYLASQIMAKVPALEARAIAADLEQKILKLANKQTTNDSNTINGMQHRFVAGTVDDGWGVLTPEDFAYATVALKKVNYIGPKIAIIPSYQEYALVTNPRIKASLNYNPSFEGIVRDGAMSGMRFSFNIYGWDVYTSEFLPTSSGETALKDREGKQGFTTLNNAGEAILFANIPERRPFRMAWRQMPKFEGQWNMAKQREEYVTIARYGLGLGDVENLVVILCNDVDSTITAKAAASA
jgi:hypothetical protein